MTEFKNEKDLTRSINGVDLTNLNKVELYNLGFQDGLKFAEKEREYMQNGFAAEGEYASGLVAGINYEPEQQDKDESKLHK